jgi:hypothetical protein
MIRETLLPDSHPQSFSESVRKASFDELHRAFERDAQCGREKHMQMIGHDDEFM